MSKVSLKKAAEELESLSEEERRALRISRFHAMPVLSSSSSQNSRPRLAHPGGPLATNKAAALGKFLKRKLSEPGGAASLDPALVEQAVNNAKATIKAGKGWNSDVKVVHVDSFSGSDEEEDRPEKIQKPAKVKKKKKTNKQTATQQQTKQDNVVAKRKKKNRMPKKSYKF